MMNTHLSEEALEALSHGRVDLAPEEALAHLSSCEACQDALSTSRSLSLDLGESLRVDALEALAGIDLDGIVMAAIASAAQPERQAVVNAQLPGTLAGAQQVAAPSRSALVAGLAAGLLIAVLPGAILQPSLPSWTVALCIVRALRHVCETLDQAVVSHLPGGWGLVMTFGWLLLLALLVPVSRLITRSSSRSLPLSLLSAALLSCLGLPSARALEFEGEFKDTQLVSLDVVQQPTSEALRKLSTAAGLGLVVSMVDDPKVTVRVRRAPLRDVLTAVLGDAPLLVKQEGKLLIVRAAPSAPAPVILPMPGDKPGAAPVHNVTSPGLALPTPPAPPAPPTPPSPPSPPGAGRTRTSRDRVTMGGSTVVNKGDRVRDLVTLGGSATVYGVVEGDVVVMGGSTHLKEGSEVFGELVTMGGRITTDPGAIIHHGESASEDDEDEDEDEEDPRTGQRIKNAVQGIAVQDSHDDEDHDDAAEARREAREEARADRDERAEEADEDVEESWFEGVLSSMSSHALLFVLGLVLLGAFPARLSALTRTIVQAPLRAAAIGVLGALAAVVLCGLLTVTIIGIPAAIVLALGSALAAYAGVAAAVAVVGGLLPLRAVHGYPIRELAAGVLLLFLLSLLPAVGDLALVVACAMGLGAIVRTRFSTRVPDDAPRPPPLVTPPSAPNSPPAGSLDGL